MRSIVEVLQRSGRWDNTLFVLTSDHGQAFGEKGIIFHTLRIDEGEIRIPLWVRYPDHSFAGEEGVGWASLIDVVPSIMKTLGCAWDSPSGVAFDQLVDRPRTDPVLTMGDGIIWKHTDNLMSPDRRRWLDRLFTAAYQGDDKVLLDATNDQYSAFDVVRDSREEHDLLPGQAERLAPLMTAAKTVASRLQQQTGAVHSAEVEDRLKSWGYI